MAEPVVGVCTPWATEADLCSPCNDYDSLGDAAAMWLEAASNVLYNLSGRQFPGECARTVRPCARRVARDGGSPSAVPGWHRSWGMCGCDDACSCDGFDTIALGAHPIIEVTEVKIDGQILDESRYRVDDYHWLRRLPDADGTNPGWPRVQDLSADASAADTWSVEFTWGRNPPPEGVLAAAVLACELALGCNPETQGECRLPKNVTTVTREGVTMILSPSDFLDDTGKTGLYEVDLFLRTWNRQRADRGSTVWTPGMSRAQRNVGT